MPNSVIYGINEHVLIKNSYFIKGANFAPILGVSSYSYLLGIWSGSISYQTDAMLFGNPVFFLMIFPSSGLWVEKLLMVFGNLKKTVV